MNTNDPAKEKTELVIDAFSYAHEHTLDIHSKNDVMKIVQALDPEHVSEEEVEELMRLLQAADNFMEKDAERKSTLN